MDQPKQHTDDAIWIVIPYKDQDAAVAVPSNFLARFNVIKKCTNKFDCLVNEMLCIQHLKPALNVQLDSPHAKVFV